MFIRTTTTRNTDSGETYTTHRLVESRRVGDKVRQVTLLNLGRHFELPKARWPDLCARIEQLLSPQAPLVAMALPATLERQAQRYAAQLVARCPQPAPKGEVGASGAAPEFAEVDTDSLQLIQPRSVGVEHAALSAMRALEFEVLLAGLGVNGVMRTAIVASIIARMAVPGSELVSHRWLVGTSALGELLEADLAGMPLSRLYRASDVLLYHRDALERALFSRVESLFGLSATVTLYDLTNTYFVPDRKSMFFGEQGGGTGYGHESGDEAIGERRYFEPDISAWARELCGRHLKWAYRALGKRPSLVREQRSQAARRVGSGILGRARRRSARRMAPSRCRLRARTARAT